MPEFKVGDKVRTTSNSNNLGGNNYCGKPKGHEFIIREIFEGGGKWYREDTGVASGVFGTDLELVESKESREIREAGNMFINCSDLNFGYTVVDEVDWSQNWITSSSSIMPSYTSVQEQINKIKEKIMPSMSSCTQSGPVTVSVQEQLIDADTQALKDVYFLDSCLNLTHQGINQLLALLFTDKKADLVAKAKEIIAKNTAK